MKPERCAAFVMAVSRSRSLCVFRTHREETRSWREGERIQQFSTLGGFTQMAHDKQCGTFTFLLD